MSRPIGDVRARFWSKVRKSSGCWKWQGSRLKRRGGEYGQFSVSTSAGRKMWKAHRFAWIATYGEIPEGKMVLHKCDNPPCVRPSHLFLGDALVNVLDMVQKNRCVRLFGKTNPMWMKSSPNKSGNSMRGRKHSEESKRRISQSHLRYSRKEMP